MYINGQDGDENEERAELDSHADTSVTGANKVLFEETGLKVSVSAFSPEHFQLEI